MAEAKQINLNGAYYGPPIPSKKSYHSQSRSSGCGCGCCLISFLFKLIATIAIIIGINVLVIWLVLRPNKVKIHVTDASLTQFNLTNNNILQYNLALNMTVRNPNKKIGIYYDRIEATAFYDDQRLSTAYLTRFYQGHKNTSYLNPVFKGENLVVLGNSQVSTFNSEKNSGVFEVDVKLKLKIRLKIGKIKLGKFKPKVECDLKLPLASNGNSLVKFETTRCDWDY